MTRTIIALATLIAGIAMPCLAQSHGPDRDVLARDSRNALLKVADAEEKKGTLLSYAESYRSDGKPVSIQGTIYAGISALEVKQCDVRIATTIVDRYAGRIGQSAIGSTQSVYDYSGEIGLTREIVDSARVVAARPSLLEHGTHALCADGQACAMHWVEFQSKEKVMKLTSTTNDIAGVDGMVRNFDGVVNRIWVPVSSEEAGMEMISLFKDFAVSCGR